MPRVLRRFTYYASQALITGLILFVSLQLWCDVSVVPLEGLRWDSLFWTVVVQAIHEDGFLGPFRRLGMPFGAQWQAWLPVIPWDFASLRLLRALGGTAAAALNLYWILSIVSTGITATFSFRCLRFDRPLAFALGTLYALLPYTFFHGTGHIVLVFPFVPPIAALCLRLAAASAEDLTAGERSALLSACALQGLGVAYYVFFASTLLLAAAALAWLRSRRVLALRLPALALALLLATTTASLAPTLVYRMHHAPNPEAQQKSARQTELFGLKIRQLLTPIPDHPLPAFRRLEEAVTREALLPEGESAWVKLGTAGTVGFLVLLGVSVASGAGALPATFSPLLRSAGALNLVALLVSLVGGPGFFFSLLVVPDIRALNRMVVFIAFFSLTGLGVLLSAAVRGLSASGNPRPFFAGAGLSALVLSLGVPDQVSTVRIVKPYQRRTPDLSTLSGFVSQVEVLLPQAAMVFQLPHTSVPVDHPPARMSMYDHGRAFVFSRSLRWSWGGLVGQDDLWHLGIVRLPPAEMARQLARAGFSAIWIDRFGYPDGGTVDLETTLASETGEAPLVSADNRFAVVSLVPLERQLGLSLAPDERGILRDRTRVIALWPRWNDGCTEERQDGVRLLRSCGREARLVLKNPKPSRACRVRLTARLRAEAAGQLHLRGRLFDDVIPVSTQERPYERELELGGDEKLRIDLHLEGGGQGPRPLQVLDFAVIDPGRRPSLDVEGG